MNCNLCGKLCNIDRNLNTGFCGVDKIKIAKTGLFYFEEPLISGKNGSGTIFFCGCSLKCPFCQNYEVSRNIVGKEITAKELAEQFKKLEDLNAHNINLVSPTQFADKIIESLNIYRPQIPIVYNTHSYENIETIKSLKDYVDVYLADLKYMEEKVSKRYCGCPDYFTIASHNILEMIKQKPLEYSKNGMLKKGVLVRHLILPINIADSLNILDWLNENTDKKALVSLMAQYTPFGDIKDFPELNRKITVNEYKRVKQKMLELNLDGFIQELSSADTVYIPEWNF